MTPYQREQEVIDLLLRAAPLRRVHPVGPGDDAAVLADGTAVTVDALVEGVHWDDRLAPADVGYKAVAVSASDLAAMAARPAWMVLALALPSPPDLGWVRGFASGLASGADRFGVDLVGGDLTRAPVRVASLTMSGVVVAPPVQRAHARPGDDLWVTGTPGLAGAGYLLDDPPAAALGALRRPTPRVDLALAVATARLAHAMMDLSDGLASDLPRLCAASGVGARLKPARLPLHPALTHLDDPLPIQVSGGDDYELLMTAPPEHRDALTALAAGHGVRLTRVGQVTRGPRVELVGRSWPGGYAHFA